MCMNIFSMLEFSSLCWKILLLSISGVAWKILHARFCFSPGYPRKYCVGVCCTWEDVVFISTVYPGEYCTSPWNTGVVLITQYFPVTYCLGVFSRIHATCEQKEKEKLCFTGDSKYCHGPFVKADCLRIWTRDLGATASGLTSTWGHSPFWWQRSRQEQLLCLSADIFTHGWLSSSSDWECSKWSAKICWHPLWSL